MQVSLRITVWIYNKYERNRDGKFKQYHEKSWAMKGWNYSKGEVEMRVKVRYRRTCYEKRTVDKSRRPSSLPLSRSPQHHGSNCATLGTGSAGIPHSKMAWLCKNGTVSWKTVSGKVGSRPIMPLLYTVLTRWHHFLSSSWNVWRSRVKMPQKDCKTAPSQPCL